MRPNKPFLRYVVYSFLLLVVLVACLLFTRWGNQLLIAGANKWVAGLHINQEAGRLLNNSPFSVFYQSDSVKVDAKKVQINWRWYDGLHFSNLSAQHINVTLEQASQISETKEKPVQPPTKKEPKPPNPALIAMLPTVELGHIAVESFHLHTPNQRVGLTQLESELLFKNSHLQINRLSATKLDIQSMATRSEPTPLPKTLAPLEQIQLALPISVTLAKLAVANITYRSQGKTEQLTALTMQAKWQKQQLLLKRLSVAYQQAKLNAKGQFSFAKNNPLNLEVQGRYQQEQAQLNLTGSLSDLAIELTNQGQYPLSVVGQLQLRKNNFPFALKFTQQNWQLNVQQQPVKLESSQLVLTGNANDYQITGDVHSQVAHYPKLHSQLNASGSLTGLHLTKLQLQAAQSKAQLTGKLDWQEGINASLHAQLQQLKSEYIYPALSSNLNGEINAAFESDNQHWRLKVNQANIKGTLDNQAVALHAQLTLNDKYQGEIKQLKISTANSYVQLAGQVQDTWQVKGKLRFDDANALYSSQESIQENKQKNTQTSALFAKGNGNFSVTGAYASPKLNWHLQLDKLTYPNVLLQQFVSQGQLEINDTMAFSSHNALQQGQIAGQNLTALILKASGNKAAHKLSVAGQAHNQQLQNSQFKMALNGGLNNTNWQGKISQLLLTATPRMLQQKKQAASQTYQLNLAEPVSLRYHITKAQLTSSAFCLQGNLAHLCVDNSQLSKQKGSVTARLKQADLAISNAFLPPHLGLLGNAQGQAKIQWKNAKPWQINGQLETDSLTAQYHTEQNTHTLGVQKLALQVQSHAQKTQGTLLLQAEQVGELNANISLGAPYKTGDLAGSIQLKKVDFAKLQPFIPALHTLAGQGQGKVTLAGTLNAPQLNGQLAITQLALAGASLPTTLENSNVQVRIVNNVAQLQGQLHQPQGGQLALVGQAHWQQQHLQLQLKITGDKFNLTPQAGINVTVSPAISLNVSDQHALVTGRVDVPAGRIKIDSLPKSAVQVSSDQIIIDAPVKKHTLPFTYQVKLALSAGNDVYIDSFGLKSYLMGDLSINASNNRPLQVQGELKLQEGKYQAFAQDLIIRKGVIGFTGSPKTPYLNIEAIRDPNNTADGVTAGVTLKGSLKKPRFEVFSEPSMPQAQALAYIVNGEPLDSEKGDNNAMLTQLLLSQGLNRSEGFIDKVGDKMGIKNLKLSTQGSGESTKVAVSGYVAPSLQVKYSVGIFDSINQVAIRYQLLQQLYIEVTSGLYDTLDILYKFDVE